MFPSLAVRSLTNPVRYIGEAFNPGGVDATSHSVTWGVLSTFGYLYILYNAWFGEVAQLADKSNSETIKKGVRYGP